MNSKTPPPSSPLLTPQLRTKAEVKLASLRQAGPAALPADQLLHELQVHQIELEMQNEELRRTQVALEESRDRYVDLYEFAPVGFLSLAETGQIEAINLTGAALLGEDRKRLLGLRFSRFFSSADLERWQRLFVRALRHEGKQRHELNLQRKDGTNLDVLLESLLAAGTDGRPMLRVALTDITGLKQATAELRANEDRLRLAKIAAGLGIFDRDIASGRLEVDERAREIWGVGPDEPVTYAIYMAGVHPDDRADAQAAVDRALDPDGKGAFDAEYRVINRADGSMRQVAANGQVFFNGRRAIRFVGTIKDVTAQKLLEKELQERRGELELLVKQQVAVQTAAAIAHELNQPLVAVSAYSEAAQRMLRGGVKDPKKLDQALEGAVQQAQRAGRTLHELLDFLHKGDATPEPVDLNEVVREAVDIAEENGYGGFRAVVDLESGLRPVLANRRQLQKVLIILLHNGVEAMRGAGMPTNAITIRVCTLAERGMALVTVTDSGKGLDAETAHRIFEPFFTTKPHGIGLGLAISRTLIEAHGGQLWADMEAGPGATFHFTLPFAA
ncbi:MAG: PAS domain S-box protein [Rhodocyclaceae bacterium]|nr:PAS domain S-box protein [Rhodocyclaceae bacterium]